MFVLFGFGGSAAIAGQITCTPTLGFTDCIEISSSGADQSFTIPGGITSIETRVFGAAGGGANATYFSVQPGGAGGGFARGTLAVTPGQTLTIVVGSGGLVNGTSARYGGGGAGSNSTVAIRRGGSGGGMSAIFTSPAKTAASALIAAGGGGGGAQGADRAAPALPASGGGGGLTGGQDGVGSRSGQGGTQTAGGAAATNNSNCLVAPSSGAQFLGGNGGSSNGVSSNEGGGGGYFGGGGGVCQNVNFIQNGPGGGGSSFIAGPGVTAGSTNAGQNSAVASPPADGASCTGTAASGGASDPLYTAGIGQGSCFGAGGDGRVIIQYSLPKIQVNKVIIGGTGAFTFTGDNGWTNQTITTLTPGSGVAGVAQKLTSASFATTITESAPPAGYLLTDVSCTGLGVGGVATPDLIARNVLLDEAATAPGSDIKCTFRNEIAADLAVTKSNGATTVNANGTTTYTLTVTNNGPSPVTGAILSDPSAAGLSVTSVVCAGTPGQCTVGTTPTILQLQGTSFTLPTLASGQTYRLAVTATVTAPSGSVSNVATITAPSGLTDPTPGNNSATDGDTIISLPPVADNDAVTGTPIGTPAVVDVLTGDAAGPGRTLVPASVRILDGTTPVTSLVVAGEGTWSVNTTPGPTQGSITFTPLSTFTGNPTPISYRVADDQGNVSNTATVTVGYDQLPAIETTKLLSVPAALVGDTVTYTILVENTGNVQMNGVALADTLTRTGGTALTLDSLAFVSADAGSVEGRLELNETATYQAFYTLVAADLAAGGLENTATATGTSDQGRVVSDRSDDGIDGDGNTTDDPTVLALVPAPTLTAEKSASVDRAKVGDVVSYTITFANPLIAPVGDLTFVDALPAGVAYVPASAAIDGVSSAPVIAGQRLSWPGRSLAAGGQAALTLRVRITATSSDVINAAQIENATGQLLSNVARASVRITEDAVFVCTDIIGKVFDDRNYSGYQDSPRANASEAIEPGLPGVRLATVDGTIITTDDFGRYSVPCAAIPQDSGSNFTLKVDPRSLPTGFRLTTENPRTMRVTPGMLTEMNFGATVGNVVDIDLTSAAFVSSSVEPVDRLAQGLKAVLDQIRDTPSMIKLSYLKNGESEKDIRARLDRIEELMRDRWRGIGRYRLVIERTIEQLQ